MRHSTPKTATRPHARNIDSEYIVRRKSSGLPPRDRPREKLQHAGRHGLADHELVALVLGHGLSGRGAIELAEDVLECVGGIHGLARTNVDQLAAQEGIGAATAARLVAAVELGRRTLERLPDERLRFASPRELAHYLMPRYGAHPVERFGLVLLDTRHQLIRVRILSTGSLDAVAASPREVFRDALSAGAAGVIVFHNHPSGDPSPSPDDVSITHRLAAAGKILGVELIDHVIIGDARYFSMKEFGGLL
jgi:DNA repair protein RadC